MLIKIKIKNLAIAFIYNITLLIIAYYLNRFFQMLNFLIFFDIMQKCFKYRFHSDSVIDDPIKATKYCKLITICVEVIYMIFCKSLNLSLYSNLIIIFSFSVCNTLLEFSIKNFIIKKDCLKDKDMLLKMCENANLTTNATKRMIMKYIDNKTYQETSEIECVDVETIKKSINRSRNKIFNNQD